MTTSSEMAGSLRAGLDGEARLKRPDPIGSDAVDRARFGIGPVDDGAQPTGDHLPAHPLAAHAQTTAELLRSQRSRLPDYFTTAVDLVAYLQAANLEGSRSSKVRTYTGPSVLAIDELGYLPMDATSAHWICQVVSRRYERGSIVLISNRGFGDWGQLFADQVVAGAILDRLLRHATLVNIKGQSYRMRAHVPTPREGAAMLG